MKRVLFLTIAFAAGFSNGGFAQGQQQEGFHSVACVKVRDGKMLEYRKFTDEARKLTQLAADSGRMSAAYRLRSVMPVGAAATCDFIYVSIFTGAPPAPLGPEELASALQRVGSSMSASDYIARISSLSQLVSSEMWHTDISVGQMQKGDYVFVNQMKVHDMPGWLELERSIWKPMAETWVKDGTLHGWIVARPVLSGTDRKYQAVTVDVLPSWDAAFKPWPLEKTFKQVHSDKDQAQVFEKLGKARDLAVRDLLAVEDKIVPATKTGGGQ